MGEQGSVKEESPEVQGCWRRLHVGGETGSDVEWQHSKLAKHPDGLLRLCGQSVSSCVCLWVPASVALPWKPLTSGVKTTCLITVMEISIRMVSFDTLYIPTS